MSAPAVTLEDVLAELRDLRATLRGRATKRQRPRLDALLLPIVHATELLGTSRPTLRELVRAGELVQVRTIKNEPRITRRSLEEYLLKLEQEAQQKPKKAPRSPATARPVMAPKKARTGAEVAAAIRALKLPKP